MSDLIKSLAYKVHPYRWSTIGKEISHISYSNLDQVRDFFKTYYAPDNAIIAIAGNISFEKTVELVEKWFGDIPSGNIKIKDIPQEPQQKEARFLEVERDVPQDAIVKAYHICGRTDEEYHCYDILSDVLSNGRSARLPQKLIMEKKLFSEVNAYISGSIDPGLFYVTGKPSEGVSLEEADKALTEEIELLKKELVDETELKKWVNKFEANDIFSNIYYLNKATNLCYFELLGKAEDINKEVDKYLALTPEKIKIAANKAFVETNCSTLYYRSKEKA